MARRALELTLEYLNTRVQFGKKIGSFQALQHRAVDAYIQTELAAACIEDALGAVERGVAPPGAAASRIKARCAHAAIHATRLAIQFHGAIGYTDEHDIGLYFKRALEVCQLAGRYRRTPAPLSSTCSRERRRSKLARGRSPSFRATPTGSGCPRPSSGRWCARSSRSTIRRTCGTCPTACTGTRSRSGTSPSSRQGWIAPAWPKAFGGMALPPDKLIAFIEEQRAVRRRAPARPGPHHARAAADAVRHQGAAGAVPPEDPVRRARLVPGLLGAERGVRSRVAPYRGHPRRRRLRRERAEDLDDARAGRDPHLHAGAHRQDREEAGRHQLLARRSRERPASPSGRSGTSPATRSSARCSSTSVRVPRANLVGELNQGWNIAKALLGFERIFGGSPKHSQYTLKQVADARRARAGSSTIRRSSRATRNSQLDAADLSAAYAYFADIVKRGEALPAKRLAAEDLGDRDARADLDAARRSGGGARRQRGCDACRRERRFTSSRRSSTPSRAPIFSGTSEIQRTILAKQVLGLPG